MIQVAISTLVEGQDLEIETANDAMECILDGKVTPSQIASFITALRMKGETETELEAFLGVLKKRCVSISSPPGSIDICGTGGDGSGTFNISTTAAFVIAADGVPVAKHGNGSVSSVSGSANVIDALGIPSDLDPMSVERCISETGMGFMFAPIFHPSIEGIMKPRKEIGIRTVFNILGPLLNPAGVRTQLVGVYDPSISFKLARVLKEADSRRAMIVHGSGLDEITNTGETSVVELRDGQIFEYTISPDDLGIETVDLDQIKGGDALENARIMMEILGGEHSPRSDIVAMNAGAGLYLAGRYDNLEEGIARARSILSSGTGLIKLRQFAQLCTNLERDRQASMPSNALVGRKMHPKDLRERIGTLCHLLLESIEGTEIKDHLVALDDSMFSSPNILTYIMLQRMIDIQNNDIPSVKLRSSPQALSASIEGGEGLSVIGEYKPSSPTIMGLMVPPRTEFAVEIYEEAGVKGISVLGEPRFFNGGSELFSEIREMTKLPMLYKDFIFSRKQVEIAHRLGADSILLIASALNIETLDELVHMSVARGLEPLIELHSLEDMEKVARMSNFDLIDMFGVNTRDLGTMETDLGILSQIKRVAGRIMVAESGIGSSSDLCVAKGYDAVLIGSMFMGCSDLGRTVTEVVRRCQDVVA